MFSGERWSLSRQGGDWALCVPLYESALSFALRLVTTGDDTIDAYHRESRF